MKESVQRESGYYWARIGKNWQIYRYSKFRDIFKTAWYDVTYKEYDFDEIDETRIEHQQTTDEKGCPFDDPRGIREVMVSQYHPHGDWDNKNFKGRFIENTPEARAKAEEMKESVQREDNSWIRFLKCCFIILNWNHLKKRAHNGQPYYKRIVKIKGFRTAIVDTYSGARQTNRYYWTIGKFKI